MKKIILCIIMLLLAIGVSAQIMGASELEKYAESKYGKKYVDAAINLSEQLQLDKNNSLTYVRVIDAPGKTKEQLYIILNYWYSSTFSGEKSVIQLNDKNAGVIIAKGCVYSSDFLVGGSGFYSYAISIIPTIKTDIKDGKVRVTYTLLSYSMSRREDGGVLGIMQGSRSRYSNAIVQETWSIGEYYPFNRKGAYKRVAAYTFVMACASSNVIMDKIEDAVKNGVAGNEVDSW